MRLLYAALVPFLLATPSAGYAQDDPSATRGVYAPREPAVVSPLQSPAASVSVPLPATPLADYAPTDADSARRVNPPGQLSHVVSPRTATATFHGYNTVTIPDYPGTSVSGAAVPGRVLSGAVNPTPIPGEPGMGSVMVNGRHAIVEQGSRRIVRFVD